MTLSSFVAMLPLLLGFSAVQEDQPELTVRRLQVEQQLLLRVPVRPRRPVQRFNWVEGQRFKCVHTNAIRGALLSGADQVDLLLPGRQRMRASFGGNCPALDFYAGFYLKTDDHRVCAGRDFVHSRMGGSCRIEGFRRLVPKLKD